jgi:iron complex transport system substrate-binding protein
MKTEISRLVGIVALLCSVFLVALPAIAADQTVQKASATALEDDFTLGIYGNANEDDTIDMRDTTYIKLVIFGKKPKTDLADANYDGKVSMLDVGQTKLIILGKDKKLTVIDSAHRVVTVIKPITKIATFSHGGEHIQMIKAIHAEDRICAVDSDIKTNDFVRVLFPELIKLPDFGTSKNLDYEVLFELKPDIVTKKINIPVKEVGPSDQEIADKLKSGGIDIFFLGSRHPREMIKSVTKVGHILDQEEEAEDYIEFYEGLINDIAERTESIPEKDKTRVYIANCDKYKTAGKGTGYNAYIEMAGGISISASESSLDGLVYAEIDPEWLIEQNPDVFVMRPRYTIFPDYGSDDPAAAKEVRDDILNTPELAKVKAIQDGRVYLFGVSTTSAASFLCIGYMAKWFYPELFEDLDMKAMHQEYLDRFQRIDFDVDKHGVFMYPPLYGPAPT